MPKQTINIGMTVNDGAGDPLRTAFAKANGNFAELYDRSAPAFHSQAEAEAGLATGKAMDALRTKQAQDAHVFTAPVAGGVARPSVRKSFERRSALDFIPASLHASIEAGTVVTDLASYLENAAAYARTPRSRLVFPSGVYPYSVSPNWAASHARILADGEVRLRCTGTGDAVILDSGFNPTVSIPGKADIKFGPFIVEGHSGGGHGVFLRAIHHSDIDINVRGCGTTKAAVAMQFGVCTIVRMIVSGNEGAWYGGGKPRHGLLLEARPLNGNYEIEPVSYCEFPRPIIEHVERGAELVSALGCQILGGTIEGNTEFGLLTSSLASANIIERVDFEANNGYDITISGKRNKLVNIDSLGHALNGTANLGLQVLSGAEDTIIDGGAYNKISVLDGALRTRFEGRPTCNRYGSQPFSNAASGASGTSGVLFDAIAGRPVLASVVRSTLTLTGTTHTYQNLTQAPQMVGISGGAGVSLFYLYDGVADGIGSTGGLFPVPPGAGFILIYASGSPPTVKVYGA